MNAGARARELLIPTLLRRRTTHGHGPSLPACSFLSFFIPLRPSSPFPFLPQPAGERYRCHEDSKFHLLFSLRADARGERELKRDDNAATASFTRLARDIYHARDILIKCDDTPRSIRTKRVYALAPTPTPVDNDIICSPLSPSRRLSLSARVRLVTLLVPFSLLRISQPYRYRSLFVSFLYLFFFSFYSRMSTKRR